MLISYLRHELHTSLNAVIGYSELMLEDASANGLVQIESGLRSILDACRQLMALVNERMNPLQLRGMDRDALGAAMRAACEASREPTQTIAATGAMLITLAEREGKYGLIPDLCKIQAAGNMLQDLLDRQIGVVPFQSTLSTGHLLHGAPSESPAPQTAKFTGRILIVDDNSMSRDLLRQTLERQGHHVHEASGGQQGLEFLAEQAYDLVLLDLRMPDLSGIEVLERLQAQGQLARQTVVMLSASDEMDVVARCIESGAADYLIKPVNMVLLRTRVSMYLELKQLRDAQRR